MHTLVAFHAHPDDETISTGGTLARAAAAGNRVVIVTATDGSRSDSKTAGRHCKRLAQTRLQELHQAAQILGVDPPMTLDYRDSGMMGDPSNSDPRCFWQADVAEAAHELAGLLAAIEADILTVYDSHGFDGHPDHIQVHRVGHVAAELSGIPRVYEATFNRDHRIRQMNQAVADGHADAITIRPTDPRLQVLGTRDVEITTAIDVSDWLDVKRRAMAAHASQIAPDSWYLRLPADLFAAVFGTEWFIRVRPAHTPADSSTREHWLWP